MEDSSTRKCEPWVSHFISHGQMESMNNLGQFVRHPSNKKQISSRGRMSDTGGKGEELRLQSQEGQELSAPAGPSQLILKMTSEKQTVDHTNKIHHDTIFVWFHTSFSNGKTQTLKKVFKRSSVVDRPRPSSKQMMKQTHFCSVKLFCPNS